MNFEVELTERIISGGKQKMSVKFDDFLTEQLQNPVFRAEYEALQPEHKAIQAAIDAEKNMSSRRGATVRRRAAVSSEPCSAQRSPHGAFLRRQKIGG